jgi:hypothetical protein
MSKGKERAASQEIGEGVDRAAIPKSSSIGGGLSSVSEVDLRLVKIEAVRVHNGTLQARGSGAAEEARDAAVLTGELPPRERVPAPPETRWQKLKKLGATVVRKMLSIDKEDWNRGKIYVALKMSSQTAFIGLISHLISSSVIFVAAGEWTLGAYAKAFIFEEGSMFIRGLAIAAGWAVGEKGGNWFWNKYLDKKMEKVADSVQLWWIRLPLALNAAKSLCIGLPAVGAWYLGEYLASATPVKEENSRYIAGSLALATFACGIALMKTKLKSNFRWIGEKMYGKPTSQLVGESHYFGVVATADTIANARRVVSDTSVTDRLERSTSPELAGADADSIIPAPAATEKVIERSFLTHMKAREIVTTWRARADRSTEDRSLGGL